MSDDDLLGFLFDALDPVETERIELELENDPLARARLEELRRITKTLAADDVVEAPMGLAARTLTAVQQQDQQTLRQEWSPPPPRMRAVDFAVVACLLCIAGGLVFPAIATMRGDQQRLYCADRLRQVGVALNSYVYNEGGQMPFIAAKGPLNNAGVFAVALREKELIPDLATLVCPSSNNSVVLVPRVGELLSNDDPDRAWVWRRHMGGSYGYLMGFEHLGGYRGRTQLDGRTPMVADRPPRVSEGAASPNSPNHGFLGQNVLFGDGAVRWLPMPVWGVENFYLNDGGTVGAGCTPQDVVIGVSEATPYPSSNNNKQL